MNRSFLVAAVVFVIFFAGVLPAGAHGPGYGWRGGVWVGPVWGPWWGPYPYAYGSETVIIEREPRIYIQPETQVSETQVPGTVAPESVAEQYYWYYCRNPKGYYPYIKHCQDGWMKVIPSPPSDRPSD